jgi:S-adenosylmethionine uptake transporter
MQSLWMVFSALCASIVNLSTKLSLDSASFAQIIFFRGLFSMLCLLLWCGIKRIDLRTQQPALHFLRSSNGIVSLGLFVLSMNYLPLVTSVTLNYTSPVWLAIFVIAFACLNRHPLPRVSILLCIAASMLGVVLLLKPAIALGQGFIAGLGLLSGLLSAIALWHVKKLNAAGEPMQRIVLYHSTGIMLVGAVWWGFTPLALSAQALPLLLTIGVLTLGEQVSMTLAMSKGKTLLNSNLMYLNIVFSAVFGVLFTADGKVIDWLGYVGIILIVSCSIAATVFSSQPSPKK